MKKFFCLITLVICMILCSCNSVHMETPMQSDIHSINDEELTPLNNEETLQFLSEGVSFVVVVVTYNRGCGSEGGELVVKLVLIVDHLFLLHN